eukprot:1189201-Prorocentrum_minimum.AAC.1
MGKRESGGKPAAFRCIVFVLTVFTLWLLIPVYRRRWQALQSINDEEQRVTNEGDESSEGEHDALSGGNSTDGSQHLGNSTFASQLLQLISVPVPIILSKAALNSKSMFSCGGSHVVKLNSYRNIQRLRHVEGVLPQYDMFYASRKHRIFETCAVVGNSGSMLEAERGQDIDEHDVVFRFNSGITEGYEQFVGTKTTFRILNNPSSQNRSIGEITISTLRDDDIRDWCGPNPRTPSTISHFARQHAVPIDRVSYYPLLPACSTKKHRLSTRPSL